MVAEGQKAINIVNDGLQTLPMDTPKSIEEK